MHFTNFGILASTLAGFALAAPAPSKLRSEGTPTKLRSRQDTSSPYPNTAAKAKGKLWFGSAIDTTTAEVSDTEYMTIFNNSDIFGQTTPGNTMKWEFTEPTQNDFTLSAGNETINLAKATGKLVRCHNLVWSSELPSWVTGGSWTNATLLAAMENHITTLIKSYGSDCYSWDVVNEALNSDGNFTSNVFLTNIGEAYVPLAYKYATAAVAATGADIKLFYNDYGIENPGTKNTAAVNLVKTIKAYGATIDGVGFESHFSTSYYPTTTEQEQAMASVAAEGVNIHVTELDVACSAVPCSTADLATQATAYYDTISACMSTTACTGMTVWDFDDKYSWIQPASNSGEGDPDLYYSNYTRHPAYTAVYEAIVGQNCSVC
ncbi:MAG: hypothetical protein M1822_006572 [Bathelium mastoideum]|nr:MAG: hypothetical protein M1822_006572 [Bathelium mastoideum]